MRCWIRSGVERTSARLKDASGDTRRSPAISCSADGLMRLATPQGGFDRLFRPFEEGGMESLEIHGFQQPTAQSDLTGPRGQEYCKSLDHQL